MTIESVKAEGISQFLERKLSEVKAEEETEDKAREQCYSEIENSLATFRKTIKEDTLVYFELRMHRDLKINSRIYLYRMAEGIKEKIRNVQIQQLFKIHNRRDLIQNLIDNRKVTFETSDQENRIRCLNSPKRNFYTYFKETPSEDKEENLPEWKRKNGIHDLTAGVLEYGDLKRLGIRTNYGLSDRFYRRDLSRDDFDRILNEAMKKSDDHTKELEPAREEARLTSY